MLYFIRHISNSLDGHATIQLLAPSGQVLSETSIKSAGGFPQTVSLNVPKELPVGSSLAAIGKFGRYSFDKRLSVKVADGSAGLIIIIQTDKPVYRAGEVVRLRILSIDHRKLPLAKDAIKGCHEFTLNGRDLLLANEDLNRRPLILTAEVTEEATAPGESVNICFLAVNVTMREVSKGCRDFKSGPDGLVRFSVPGLRSSPSSLRVTAKAEGGSLNPPTTTVLLQPWRSLSQRYLRVLAPGQKLKCGVSTPVRFHYTKLKNHSSVAFNYQVFSGRRVVEQGRFEPRVSQDDTDDRIPVESGLQSGGFITAELSLEPKPEWGLSSKARLLLYYAHPKGELIGDSRRLQVEPCTSNPWQAGALCLHPTRGVGLSNAALNALQPFFAQLTLPAVAKRGELVPVTATLFSYLQACVPVKLSLNADSACMKLLGEPQKRDCLCGNESIVLRVQVRPLCLGAINITLHALGLAENKGLCDEGKPLETRQARDSLRKSLLVTAEGQPQEKSTAKYICLNGSGEGPQKHEFPLELPRNVVSGSSRGVFTLSGNVGSPVSVDRLDKLVRLPTGCGEQNLALLAPNVFVLDYLNSSGERGHPLESKLKENIAKGYQRQLNYRHAEGGYSAFGSQDPEPSLWLTAFAVRTFGRSRRFMPIDEAELSGSIRWILSNQYDNGCFPSVGRVLNSRLKGGLEGHSLAPLTAYVLISLLEAGAEIPQVSRVGAVRCLLQELQQQQQDSHTMALAAYAFSLFEDSKASELLASLRDEAQPGNGESIFFFFFLCFLRTEATLHWHKNVSTAVAVETASYVVLASLKLGGRAAAKSVLPVVRWVLEQRNHDGGFVSTQDTVVALQVLAEYAKATSSSDTRLQIRVSSEGLGSTLTVNRENALLKQELFLPVVPTVLHIEATGTGCAFIQATVKYNVPAAEETKSFGFWVTALHANCRPQVKVNLFSFCSYLVSWAMSGMVIVQVKMQSGYRFEKVGASSWCLCLEEQALKRHEVDQDQVNLYFEELSNRKSCALLELVQDYVVENAVPATVTLQDYYEP
ncbi:alpha-macroglobulin, putative, partial [Ixodes scapularis]